MKPQTRMIAIVGLVILGIGGIAAGIYTSGEQWVSLSMTVVVGIVGVLKEGAKD